MSIQLNIDAIDAGDLLKQLTALAQALAGNIAHINSIASAPLETTARGSTETEAKVARSRKAPAETKGENPTDANAASTDSATKSPSATETAASSGSVTAASPSEGNASAATADTAASTSEASAPAAEGEGKKTYADVRAAMLKLTTAKSREAAIELLTKYKVGKAQELTEDQYEGVIKDALDAAAAE